MEIIFHGLGGQGAKSAAQILVEAASEEGKEIHAFPEYGPERRGAPVRAFVRISDKKIRTHQPIVEPDIIIFIDDSLITKESVSGLKQAMIVNTKKSVKEIREMCGFKGDIHVIDASSLGYPNVPMLGALVKVEPVVKLGMIVRKIDEHFGAKLGKENTDALKNAVKKAYEMVE